MCVVYVSMSSVMCVAYIFNEYRQNTYAVYVFGADRPYQQAWHNWMDVTTGADVSVLFHSVRARRTLMCRCCVPQCVPGS